MEGELDYFANQPKQVPARPIFSAVRVLQKKFRNKGPTYEYQEESHDVEKVCVVGIDPDEIGRGVEPTPRNCPHNNWTE